MPFAVWGVYGVAILCGTAKFKGEAGLVVEPLEIGVERVGLE